MFSSLGKSRTGVLYQNNEKLLSIFPTPAPPGQDCFKQFPTPGAWRAGLVPGVAQREDGNRWNWTIHKQPCYIPWLNSIFCLTSKSRQCTFFFGLLILPKYAKTHFWSLIVNSFKKLKSLLRRDLYRFSNYDICVNCLVSGLELRCTFGEIKGKVKRVLLIN